MSNRHLHATIADVVERTMADCASIPGLSIAMHSREHGDVGVARGMADPATGEALTPAHAVRIASCTKTFVASTVMVLASKGRLRLDQPVGELLAPTTAALWAQYEHAPATTVRHLLQHRSGLVDHSTFPEFDAPEHTQWTPAAQLAIAVGKPALFAPGAAFSYSDSGYVLLGQMIEYLTGRTLAAAVREALHLDPAEFPSIHWEVAEPTPAGLVRAHQFHFGADTYDWNPSLDLFGGGGIVATMPDLARWWTALFAGQVHSDLDLQLDGLCSTAGPDGTPWPNNDLAGLGIFRRTVDGIDIWSHGGYWGLQTLHVPALQISAALVITHRATDVPTPTTVADDLVRALAVG